jgi:hypothetical protein
VDTSRCPGRFQALHKPGTAKLKITLTANGRALLKTATRIKLVALERRSAPASRLA